MIFYVMPKKSYVITCTIIPYSTFIWNRRVYKLNMHRYNKNFIFYFQHAPGIPKVLVGNRLHLAFKRQVDQAEAETYADKNAMGFFEVSPLVNFNISETFVELARMALKRNGMERLWRSNKGNRFIIYGVHFLWFGFLLGFRLLFEFTYCQTVSNYISYSL